MIKLLLILCDILFFFHHSILFELFYFVWTVILNSLNCQNIFEQILHCLIYHYILFDLSFYILWTVSIFLDWFYILWSTITFCLFCHFIFFELSVYFWTDFILFDLPLHFVRELSFYFVQTVILVCLKCHFKIVVNFVWITLVDSKSYLLLFVLSFYFILNCHHILFTATLLLFELSFYFSQLFFLFELFELSIHLVRKKYNYILLKRYFILLDW